MKVTSVLSSRPAWALLGIVAAVALIFGSIHSTGSSVAAREARLDTLIKCPACEDLSIAQSSAPSAVALRLRVDSFVASGWSDARVERWVTARFGSAALLVPVGTGADTTLYAIPLAAIGLSATGLAIYLWRRRSLATTHS